LDVANCLLRRKRRAGIALSSDPEAVSSTKFSLQQLRMTEFYYARSTNSIHIYFVSDVLDSGPPILALCWPARVCTVMREPERPFHKREEESMPRSLLQSALPVVLLVAAFAPSALASTISYTGNLRTDANVTSCGAGCTLGSADTDADYAQYAAVVESFTLFAASTVQITSFSYGGGTNGNGTVFAVNTDGTGFTTVYRARPNRAKPCGTGLGST